MTDEVVFFILFVLCLYSSLESWSFLLCDDILEIIENMVDDKEEDEYVGIQALGARRTWSRLV